MSERAPSGSQQNPDPFKDPKPSGSKKRSAARHTTPPPPPCATPAARSDLEDSQDPTKTPKKARKATKAPARNRPLWDHYSLNPDVPAELHNKNTKVFSLPAS